MKGKFLLAICFLLIYGFHITHAQPLLSDEPVLESYSISQGGNQSVDTRGFDVKLTDKYFGNGLARARLRYRVRDQSGILSLEVTREAGGVQLALLVFRVEVRGYDLSGNEIYSRNLAGFSFGDSQGGEWFDALEDIPLNASRLQVTFIGNYE